MARRIDTSTMHVASRIGFTHLRQVAYSPPLFQQWSLITATIILMITIVILIHWAYPQLP